MGEAGAAPWWLCLVRGHGHCGPSTQPSRQRLELQWPKWPRSSEAAASQLPAALHPFWKESRQQAHRRPPGPSALASANRASRTCKAFGSLSWARRERHPLNTDAENSFHSIESHALLCLQPPKVPKSNPDSSLAWRPSQPPPLPLQVHQCPHLRNIKVTTHARLSLSQMLYIIS